MILSREKLQPVIADLRDVTNLNYWRLSILIAKCRIKSSDYNSVLGVFWSVLAPVVTWLILYSIFNKHFGNNVEYYSLYLLVAVLLVNFFILSTSLLCTALLRDRELILNAQISHKVIFGASFIQSAWKFFIELSLCLLCAALFGILKLSAFLLLIPLLLSFLLLTLSTGIMLSIIYLFVSDMEHLWKIATGLLIFVTPVFYSLSDISTIAAFIIYFFNPLTPAVTAFQDLITKGSTSLGIYLHALFNGFFIASLVLPFYSIKKSNLMMRI